MLSFCCKCGERVSHDFSISRNWTCEKCKCSIYRYYDQKDDTYYYEVLENDR